MIWHALAWRIMPRILSKRRRECVKLIIFLQFHKKIIILPRISCLYGGSRGNTVKIRDRTRCCNSHGKKQLFLHIISATATGHKPGRRGDREKSEDLLLHNHQTTPREMGKDSNFRLQGMHKFRSPPHSRMSIFDDAIGIFFY